MEVWKVTYLDDEWYVKHFTFKGTFDEFYKYLSSRSENLITYDVYTSKGKVFTIEV